MGEGKALRIELAEGIDKVGESHWDGLCPTANPFVSHRFLRIMEESGSASLRTGWQPVHLLLQDDEGTVGAAPLYVKSHSYGEYVFDWGWADAYERAGGRYYPKLQSAVPFSPVPGPRLLTSRHRAELAAGLRQAAEQMPVSSLHVTFCGEDEAVALAEAGFIHRRGIQFHWHNRGYGDFDDFLDSLKSAKRKMIRRERREVAETGLRFECLAGDRITPGVMREFYPFYLATVDKRWGQAYLTPEFFTMLGAQMPQTIVLVAVYSGEQMVAAALNLRDGTTLYGRVWGCLDDYRFLHFETCYYRAIEFAIAHGIERVEAGAQGPHKLQRGYEPVFTHSAHWIRDPGLRHPVRRFVESEWAEMDLQIGELRRSLPFRNDEDA
ncbi:MAG: N-acetyltransferase [Geminicoccaceae bacterium]|nr:N-acetyltransferase [Geminicoccaceae bacterium]